MDIIRKIGPFDALITDPPYSSGGSTLSEKQKTTSEKYTSLKGSHYLPDFEGDAMDQRAWMYFMRDVLASARMVCRTEAPCVLFTDWRQLPALSDALQWAGWIWRGVVVWDKLSSRPQRGRYRQQAEFILWGSNGRFPFDRSVDPLPGVYSFANVQKPERLHQTQKPVDLMRALNRICVPGGHILDPFAGSGSTLEAARMDGYSATGIELSRRITQTAAERLKLKQIEEGRWSD